MKGSDVPMTDIDGEYPLLAAKLEIADGRYRKALDLLDRIKTRTVEEEAEKLILRGEGLEGLNESAQAREAYVRAQSLVPGFAISILREGVLRYHRGDVEGARILLHRYVERESGNPEAFHYLALCEQNPARKATFVRKTVALDGPDGLWSRELRQSLAT